MSVGDCNPKFGKVFAFAYLLFLSSLHGSLENLISCKMLTIRANFILCQYHATRNQNLLQSGLQLYGVVAQLI